MKYLIVFICLVATTISCKTEKKQETPQPKKEYTILEKVAHAHGFENWKNINKLAFTFNVDRDTNHFERSWIWKTKQNMVTAISAGDSTTYNRNKMDSIAHKTNSSFINDKFWLMVPYNLIWDKNNFDYTHTKNIEAPISKRPMNKLTIVYKNEGGYTPGDAYDLFFEEDYILKEWIFRRANQKEPSMLSTWENYIETGGLKIATVRQNAEGDFKLHFTGLETSAD